MGKILYPGLKEFTKEKILEGMPSGKIFELARRKYDYDSDIQSFYKYISKTKRQITEEEFEEFGEDIDSIDDQFITILEKKKTVSGDELCEELSCSPNEIYDLIQYFRRQGYEIIMDEKKVMLSNDIASDGEPIDKPLETTEIVFGVASDLHFGSKMCQITALHEFAHICEKKGAKYIFVPGDVVAGHNVYPGQQYEVYALSAEEQESSVIRNLPRGDYEWFMLGGNHDYSFIKRGGGHNPLLAIEAQREDVTYVGFDEADIPILKGVDLRMWHPSGGVPYSVSYRMQKAIEQIAYTELAKICRNKKDNPTIRFLLAGHLHIQVQAMFGSIFGAQCGTFEGQTSYLVRKGLHPLIGGYIIKADIRKKSGIILNFEAKYYMFPDEIKDDWKHYDHSIVETKIDTPIFER
jgi:hypothetical protein